MRARGVASPAPARKWSGIVCDDLVHLKRWRDAMRARPACQRGVEVPVPMQRILEDERASQAFAENARKTLQT